MTDIYSSALYTGYFGVYTVRQGIENGRDIVREERLRKRAEEEKKKVEAVEASRKKRIEETNLENI
jgi:hypothetical protein